MLRIVYMNLWITKIYIWSIQFFWVSISCQRASLSFNVGSIYLQALHTCCDTAPVFGKDIPMLSFLFMLRVALEGRDWEEIEFFLACLQSEMLNPKKCRNKFFGAHRPNRLLRCPTTFVEFPSRQKYQDS